MSTSCAVTGITHYLYSTEGQLLAELDAQGNTHREYLYLQSWPVAVVSYTPAVPAGSGTAALLVGDAAAETAEDYPEVAETAPTDPKPTTSTGVTTSGTSDRAADGVATSTAATTPAIQLHYLHPDHLGTPRLATDSAQRVVWRWDSAPFGDTPAQEDPDGDGLRFTLNLRFPGQYFDAETGLHYNYFRDYDPVVGRYLESDPIGLRGGVNTYGYVGGRPLVAVDSRGAVSETALGSCVAGGLYNPACDLAIVANGCKWLAIAVMAASATSSEGQNDVKQKEHDAYHQICDRKNPNPINTCEWAKFDLKKGVDCYNARKDWLEKWEPGNKNLQGQLIQMMKFIASVARME